MAVSNCSITVFARSDPNNFYMLPKLKEFMKGHKFVDDEDVIHTASDWLRTKNSFTTESGLWKNAVGQVSFLLEGTVLKSENDFILLFTISGYGHCERLSKTLIIQEAKLSIG